MYFSPRCFKFLYTVVSLCGISANASAATSLLVSGHAGMVGQYTNSNPPLGLNYNAIRVPIGLLLSAKPSDNLDLYLGLDYAYNNYPSTATLLGQTSSTSSSNPNGQSTPVPFAYATNGTTAYGQNTDTPVLTSAYFTYQTSAGLLKAGRFPRHWGLGIWYNSEWSPTGAALSTTDAVAFKSDLNLFDVTVYYERLGTGVGGTNGDANASAYSVEVRLKADPADSPSSGVNREIGLAFSKFDHNISNTTLNILDVYGKFYLEKFFAGGEVLYPSGHTQNPNYQTLGGSAVCSLSYSPASTQNMTCNSQDISAFAFLLKSKYQFDGRDDSSLASTEAAQKILGTADRMPSQIASLWIGYASGGSNQFNSSSTTQGNNSITAVSINPNIQPAFLMFNNTMPPVTGMPNGAITNATFVRADYTYESPKFGALGPVITWSRLNSLNGNYSNSNPICKTAPTVTPNSAVNKVCLGSSGNLGVEVDANYHYTTQDKLDVGVDLGYWLVGSAWQVYGKGAPNPVFGGRVTMGTEF